MTNVGNPLWAIFGIWAMALFCGWLGKRIAIVERGTSPHAQSLPLDGLRGILASSVFFHHASVTYGFYLTGLWAYTSSNFYNQLGPTAVTLFFFISGYLFWRKMLKGPASVRTKKLVPNRARRIMPAYFASTALLFVIVAFITGFKIQEPKIDLAKELLHWLFLGYPYENGPPLDRVGMLEWTGGIFWTLQFEWMFYLMLPALTWARAVWKVFLCIGVAIFIAAAMSHLQLGVSSLSVNVIPSFQRFVHMFAAGFSIGMLAAHGTGGARITGMLRSSWMTIPATILLALQLFLIPGDYNWYEPLLLVPIFFMIVAGNSFLGLLTSWPLRALGTVSYSIYVFHALLLHTLTRAFNHFHPIRLMSPALYWLCILPIGLVITAWSTLSYRFIEKPFLLKRNLVGIPAR